MVTKVRFSPRNANTTPCLCSETFRKNSLAWSPRHVCPLCPSVWAEEQYVQSFNQKVIVSPGSPANRLFLPTKGNSPSFQVRFRSVLSLFWDLSENRGEYEILCKSDPPSICLPQNEKESFFKEALNTSKCSPKGISPMKISLVRKSVIYNVIWHIPL